MHIISFNKKSCLFFILLFVKLTVPAFAQDFLMQGWYWDYPKTTSGYLWADTIKNHAAELKNAGFTYIWLPPLSRSSFGNSSNGYDPKDLYDLGEFGNGATGFGTRMNVDELITQFNSLGLKAVADVVYNHRDGGKAENNPELKNYINNFNYDKANTGYNPFPYDRFRIILPIGGATGNNAGDYYFKISSASAHSKFINYEYKVYMQTNRKGWQNLTALTESEPNGGGDCSQANNNISLGRDMYAINDNVSSCRTDEFHLSLAADDFYSAGDTIFIYFGNRNSGYSDLRIYGIWAAPRSADIAGELIYQTYTDFTNMPSGQGAMNYQNFKPNSTFSTKLDGDWDWLWFFYDYDQNIGSTKNVLFDWSRWLWNDVGIRGLRMDAVKHFPPEFVGNLLTNLHLNGINPGLVVGEFYDSNTSLLKGWIDQVYLYMDETAKSSIAPRVFDFSLRDALEKASDQFGYDVRNIFNSSIVDAHGANGINVVTFANNHDFRSAGQAIDNDPILAYAYLLTNNQIGMPCVFYPDYYGVTGFANGGMKQKIDALMNVHRNFIYGSSARDYLTNFSTTYNPVFNTGFANTTLVYQLRNNPSGKDVLVAINYAGAALDMWVGVNMAGLSIGTTFGDQIGNATTPTLTVASDSRVNIKLPARSYAVWVEGEAALPVELTSFSASLIGSTVKLNWQTATEVNNYGFEIQRLKDSKIEGLKDWEKVGFVAGTGNSNSSKSYSFTEDLTLNLNHTLKVQYRLKQIDNDGQFEYSKDVEVLISKPDEFTLEQNYPNPFNPITKIRYSIPTSPQSPSSQGEEVRRHSDASLQMVTLKVYDILGKEVATLVNEAQEPGNYEINFSTTDGTKVLSSGVYFYRLLYGEYIISKKMILIQ